MPCVGAYGAQADIIPDRQLVARHQGCGEEILAGGTGIEPVTPAV